MTLQKGEITHWEKLKRHAGIHMFYSRGEQAIELIVVPARGGNDPLNFGGSPMEDESKSFILGVSDLHNFFPPKKGDTIRMRETGQEWEIKPNSVGACHTESGNYGIMIRVHAIAR